MLAINSLGFQAITFFSTLSRRLRFASALVAMFQKIVLSLNPGATPKSKKSSKSGGILTRKCEVSQNVKSTRGIRVKGFSRPCEASAAPAHPCARGIKPSLVVMPNRAYRDVFTACLEKPFVLMPRAKRWIGIVATLIRV